MTYHILNNNDFKILADKRFVIINKNNYLYNNTIVFNKILQKYKIEPSMGALNMIKGIIDKYSNRQISLYDINSFAQIDHFCFYIYDTKEFWEEELKGNKFKEIEL